MLDGSDNSLKFDQYLSGEMTPEERGTFERMIRHDASLSEAFRLHGRTTAGLKQAAHAARKAELLADLQTNPPAEEERGQLRRFMPMLLTAAAMVIVLLSVSLYLGLTGKKQPWQMAYLQEVPAFPTERGEADQLESIRQAFREQNWEEAESLLKTVLAQDEVSGKEELRFFLGLCQVKNKDSAGFGQASEVLSQVPKTSIYYEDASWWMALEAAQMDDDEKAMSLLEEISSQEGHLYQKQAQAVLARLREWRIKASKANTKPPSIQGQRDFEPGTGSESPMRTNPAQ